tara:strand:+ start:1981 stop:2172 length:192 start_codon:yes stop_codon:yes gene_type:complete
MKPKFDIFDMHTGKFIDQNEDDYDKAYMSFLMDLDEYTAEQEVLYKILSQKYHNYDWSKECMD